MATTKPKAKKRTNRAILSPLVAKLGPGKLDEAAAFEFFKAYRAALAAKKKMVRAEEAR